MQQAAPTALPGTLTTKSRTHEGGCREAIRGFAEVGTGPIGLWRNGQVRGMLCTPQGSAGVGRPRGQSQKLSLSPSFPCAPPCVLLTRLVSNEGLFCSPGPQDPELGRSSRAAGQMRAIKVTFTDHHDSPKTSLPEPMSYLY